MATKPFGPFGSLVRVLREDSGFTALVPNGSVDFDSRPSQDTQYPLVAVVDAGQGKPEYHYDFEGNKLKLFRPEFRIWTTDPDLAEQIYIALEKVLESKATPAKVAAYVEATPDGIELGDPGGARLARDRPRRDPAGKYVYLYRVPWELTVATCPNTDRRS